MQYFSQIKGIKETEEGTDLIIHIPGEHIQKQIMKYKNGSGINALIRIDDNRRITSLQNRKLHAIIGDIADYTVDNPEFLKQYLKYMYCAESGEQWFSVSDCSITTARNFITFLIDFTLKNDIPLSDLAINRTDDIDRYLWGCIKYGKCCICGRKGETHHWNAIGMGRDRRKIDDSDLRKMQLCRIHHTEIETIGRDSFEKKYHVYGIIYREE